MPRAPGTYILPLLHPASFFRSQTMQFTSLLDWQKAVRIQKEGPSVIHQPIEDWQWRPTLSNLEWYFRGITRHAGCGCGSEWDGPWSIDFEATVAREVVCLGLWSCAQPTLHRGLCIPFLSQGGVRYWTSAEEQAVMQMVCDFFTSERIPKIGQNTVGYDTGYPPFNSRALIKTAWGIDVRGIIGDTMAAHHTCFSELRHGLSFLSSVATDMGPYKEELWEGQNVEEDDTADDWTRILDRPDAKVRKYNLKDAFAQAVVWLGMVQEMGAAYRVA